MIENVELFPFGESPQTGVDDDMNDITFWVMAIFEYEGKQYVVSSFEDGSYDIGEFYDEVDDRTYSTVTITDQNRRNQLFDMWESYATTSDTGFEFQ